MCATGVPPTSSAVESNLAAAPKRINGGDDYFKNRSLGPLSTKFINNNSIISYNTQNKNKKLPGKNNLSGTANNSLGQKTKLSNTSNTKNKEKIHKVNDNNAVALPFFDLLISSHNFSQHETFLLDTGSVFSMLSRNCKSRVTNKIKLPMLLAVNDTSLSTLGTLFLNLAVDGRVYSQEFLVADISTCILGYDFFRNNGLVLEFNTKQTTPRVYQRPIGCTEVSLPCQYGCVQVKAFGSKSQPQLAKKLIGVSSANLANTAVQTTPIPIARTKKFFETFCTAVSTATQTLPIPLARNRLPKICVFSKSCQTLTIKHSSIGIQTGVPIAVRRILSGMNKQCQTIPLTSCRPCVGTLVCRSSNSNSLDQLVEPF